jgi:hypothetical protein
MANVKPIPKVKLVISVFSAEKEKINRAKNILQKKFGLIDYESDDLRLVTSYYENELGPDLIRRFYSFKKLINRDKIAEIKILTNKIEDKFKIENKRTINIDPGYISLGKFILATTKNQQHRIYLKKGIFAECALRYNDKSFTLWPWTYPDYSTREYVEEINNIRKIYYKQIT